MACATEAMIYCVMLGCMHCAYEKDVPHPNSYELYDMADDYPTRYLLTPHRRQGDTFAVCMRCGRERRWGVNY